MEWVEVTAKTVAEAKDKALDYLGVDEAQAEFEVLEEPRVGFLKRLKGEARVRARIKPTVPRPKAERRDRKRGRSREGAGPGRSDSSRGEGTRGERPAGEGDDTARGPRRTAGSTSGTPGRRGEGGGRAGGGRSGGQRHQADDARTGGDGPSQSETEAGAEVAAPTVGRIAPQSAPAPDEPASREEPMSTMSDEERTEAPTDDGRQTEHAVDFLTGLVAAFGVEATVTSSTVDEHYDEVRIDGQDLGLLIGQRALTLDSVQELARVVAQRRSGGRGESRLRVDIGGYRQRRREALERFARQLADEVKESGKVKALEPMNSADRKVVHDVVGTIEGVATLSEGEDPRRRVVIVPAS